MQIKVDRVSGVPISFTVSASPLGVPLVVSSQTKDYPSYISPGMPIMVFSKFEGSRLVLLLNGPEMGKLHEPTAYELWLEPAHCSVTFLPEE